MVPMRGADAMVRSQTEDLFRSVNIMNSPGHAKNECSALLSETVKQEKQAHIQLRRRRTSTSCI
jgi:hypothetical protein